MKLNNLLVVSCLLFTAYANDIYAWQGSCDTRTMRCYVKPSITLPCSSICMGTIQYKLEYSKGEHDCEEQSDSVRGQCRNAINGMVGGNGLSDWPTLSLSNGEVDLSKVSYKETYYDDTENNDCNWQVSSSNFSKVMTRLANLCK